MLTRPTKGKRRGLHQSIRTFVIDGGFGRTQSCVLALKHLLGRTQLLNRPRGWIHTPRDIPYRPDFVWRSSRQALMGSAGSPSTHFPRSPPRGIERFPMGSGHVHCSAARNASIHPFGKAHPALRPSVEHSRLSLVDRPIAKHEVFRPIGLTKLAVFDLVSIQITHPALILTLVICAFVMRDPTFWIEASAKSLNFAERPSQGCPHGVSSGLAVPSSWAPKCESFMVSYFILQTSSADLVR